jgi:signal transduction histidine kinase
MQSLDGYIEKIKKLIDEYHSLRDKLNGEEKDEWIKLERELDIDFILNDIGDLTKSCLDGARRTRDIVSGLRTFSRMDSGSFRIDDIQAGLLSTLKLLEPEFKNRITVHKELGQLSEIECNLQQLNQVFVNLLSNAAHAIKGKGDVWVRTRNEGNNVVIEIEDSGSGIAKENLNKVFDPFFTTKKVGEGTGLGLSIAYGLVQKHQGNINVSSVLGKGTVFVVTLPIRQNISKAS